jgi:hypothetical protein
VGRDEEDVSWSIARLTVMRLADVPKFARDNLGTGDIGSRRYSNEFEPLRNQLELEGLRVVRGMRRRSRPDLRDSIVYISTL